MYEFAPCVLVDKFSFEGAMFGPETVSREENESLDLFSPIGARKPNEKNISGCDLT